MLFLLFIAIGLAFLLWHRQHQLSQPTEFTGACWGEVVDTEFLNLREEPTSDSKRLKIINQGTKVYIEQVTSGEEVEGDNRWYLVNSSDFQGYVSAVYVEVTKPSISLPYSASDLKFQSTLAEQGFPRDYFANLLQLHRLFPSWHFSAAHFDFSLEAVAADQYRISYPANLVPLTYPAVYKSEHPKHYDATGDYYVEYEPGWVAASYNAIYDALNPRASLNGVDIFKFESLSYDDNIHSEDLIAKLLADTFMAGEQPVRYVDFQGREQVLDINYAQIIGKAAREANVSPHHLVSRITQELSLAGSPQAFGQLEGLMGYYNFLNIGAYGSEDPARSGVEFAKAGYDSPELNQEYDLPWDNPAKAIIGGAKFLSRDYINFGQNTIYYEKFNLNGGLPLRHGYMTNVVAPESEAKSVYMGYRDLGMLGISKEFLIPVFR